jgi:hypothetical protein
MKYLVLALFLMGCGSEQSSSSQNAQVLPAQVQVEASPSPSPSPKVLFNTWTDPITGNSINLTTALQGYIVIEADDGNGEIRQTIQIGDASQGIFGLGNAFNTCLTGDQECESGYAATSWASGTYSYSLEGNVLDICSSGDMGTGLCWDLE